MLHSLFAFTLAGVIVLLARRKGERPHWVAYPVAFALAFCIGLVVTHLTLS